MEGRKYIKEYIKDSLTNTLSGVCLVVVSKSLKKKGQTANYCEGSV